MARKSDSAKRAMLVEKALEVFGDRGFRGTTIKHIAARAGIAPGSVYTYFKDKNALFRSTLDEGWDDFLASLDELAASREPFARTLERLLATGFAELSKRLALVRGIVFEADRRDLLRGKIDELCRRIERIFAAARRQGTLRPVPDPAAWRAMLRVTVNGILFSAAAAPPGNVAGELRSLKAAVRGMVAARIGEETGI
ncbi:MAG: TetR/AcrR family transcriptional regulator [Spirochaetes bacterium]|nr:TetR/AcrR family transcriptional regulator [Spirochaetota bacterium]